jgi:serine/threonine-protein kinase HipA
MALKLNGKDDRLSLQDFLALARTIGLPTGEAEATVAELASRLAARAASLRLPDFAGRSDSVRAAQDKVIAMVTERSAAFAR